MIGRTVLHYRILSPLGSGGMGVVYLAEDERLGRHVALKFLPATWSQQPGALERFRVEARAASSLSHPGICAIYDVGNDGDAPFIVMEALKGETLQERIAKGPMKVSEVLDIGVQLADALDAAHSHGVVHRDIKPANIFLGEKNRVKVLDFGLAKLTAAHSLLSRGVDTTQISAFRPDEQMTMPGTAIGTVSYMSPEQARGEDIDARTDLFSLGTVLYEMLTGARAFGGTNAAVVFEAILNRAPRPMVQTNRLIPPALEGVVAKALEKDRELRYQHASDLEAELKRIRRDLDVIPALSTAVELATPAAVLEQQVATPVRRRPSRYALYGVAAAVVALAAAGIVWLQQSGARERPTTPQQVEETTTPLDAPPPVISTSSSATGQVDGPRGQTAPTEPANQVLARPQTARIEQSVETPREPARPSSNPPADSRTQRQTSRESAPPAQPAQTPPAFAAPAPESSANAGAARDNAPAASAPAPSAAPPPETASVAPSPAQPAPESKPAPPVAQEAAASEGDEPAIRRVIRLYQQAIESKDMALYRSVRPGLTAAEEAVVRNSFRQVGAQEITIRIESLNIDGRTATARIARQDSLATGGRRQTQNSTQTLHFQKSATGWVITD